MGKAVKISEFSGSSPPEIFVGRWNYPNVYTGILAPQEHGNTEQMSSAEIWQKNKLPIQNILQMRNQLIYGRTQSNIHKPLTDKKFLPTMQEVAMTHKSVGTEFKLKKPVSHNPEKESRVPLISNAAPIEKVRLEENAPVKKKIDYLVQDKEVKSAPALIELHKSGIPNSSLIKVLSAGLLGLGKNRKLVPTRWSITAVDDTISKDLLKKIKTYKEIPEFQVFSANYVGNHYHFLLLPDKWSFEVIEIALKSKGVWKDYESFFPRKKYADSVTGAYYANRLALTEYLEKIKRQCSCLVIREIRPEYSSPLGVGILRQTSREAFSLQGKKFSTLKEALNYIQENLKQPITNYTVKSKLLTEYGKQSRLSRFF
ncbi:MAG: hypothetical protein KC506_02455 [Nanoarchaeota archaeon]|nr:hypothetical protein [Nanoarchaeota archaeon]